MRGERRERMGERHSMRSMGSDATFGTPSTTDSSASFRTAATSATSQTVGSSLLRNFLPSSMRSMNSNGNPSGQTPSGRTSNLNVGVEGLQREVADLRSDLDMMRANRQQEQRVYTMELRKLECEKSAVEKRMQILLRDMNDKNAMSEYAALIRKAAPGSIDSSYVLKLQAQLAKAMHQMGVVQNQLTLTEQACDGVVKEMRDEMRKNSERSARSEIDYLNQIMKLQDDNITMKRRLDALEIEQQMRVIEEGAVETEPFLEDLPPPIDDIRVKAHSKSNLEDQNSHRKPSSKVSNSGNVIEEEGIAMEPPLQERHPPIDGIRIKANSKSKLDDQNAQRKPVIEEEGIAMEPPLQERHPPVDGIRIKSNSKSKLDDQNAQRKPSSKVSGSGIVNQGDDVAMVPSLQECHPPIDGIRIKSNSKSKLDDQNLHRKQSSKVSSGSGNPTTCTNNEEQSSARSAQRKSPVTPRASDRSRASDEASLTTSASRAQQRRVARAKAAAKGMIVDDAMSGRTSQRRTTSSRTKAENQQQHTSEGPAFGDGLIVKSSSKSKPDFPKTSGDDGDVAQQTEIVDTKRDSERALGKLQSSGSKEEKGWVEFGETGHFNES